MPSTPSLKIIIVTLLVLLLISQLKLNNPFQLLQLADVMEGRCEHATRESMKDQMNTTKIYTENPQFIFLMGTEGSGHHLWSKLVENSPNLRTLKALNLVGEAETLTRQLFYKRDLSNSLFLGAPCHDDWNGTKLVEMTAEKLKALSSSLPAHVTVPLNGIASTKQSSGMMSYPNFRSNEKCAGFRHPDVNLLKHACHMAQVTCHYIVQHRDPLELLRSTTQNRKFHSLGYAIPLYTSMLNAIRFQMMQVQESFEICWDYDSTNPPARLGTLLGWRHEDEFRQGFSEVFNSSQNGNDTKMAVAHNTEHVLLLESLFLAYDELRKACQEFSVGGNWRGLSSITMNNNRN